MEQEQHPLLSHMVLISSIAAVRSREGIGCGATGEGFTGEVGLPSQAEWGFQKRVGYRMIA